MTTQYTYRLTVCTPMHAIDDANQLALIVGESPADVNTFTHATHEKDGRLYACISTVVKPVVASYTEGLPQPAHAQGADYEAAARALGAVTWDLRPRVFEGAPQDVLSELGFTPLEVEMEAGDEAE